MDMKPTFMISLKIYWSLLWRGIVAANFVIGGFTAITFLVLMLIFGLESLMAGLPYLTLGIKGLFPTVLGVAFIVISLYVIRWIYNCLPEIEYREGRVIFMKNTEIVKKFTVFDTICVVWSQAWRSLLLMFPVYKILLGMTIAYYGINNIDMPKEETFLFDIIVNILSVFAAILAIKWMIASKKEGRWIRLEAREEMKAGE